MPDRLPVTVSTGLQPEIDEDPVATPECVVELLQFQFARLDDPEVNTHLLAPKRPALIKDRVLIKHPPPLAPVGVREDELQMMPGIRLVRAGQFQPEVLLAFREFFRVRFFLQP